MNKPTIKVHPSILSSDFGHLADELKRLEEAGADAVHIDVMDGNFVPNITMGANIVAAIKRNTTLKLDIHLMIYNPFDYIERFVQAGADSITFHFEATEDVMDVLTYIRKCNVKAGLAFCPETSLSMIPKYLPYCDLVLLMTVHPGFGGQEFMPEVLEKIQFTREFCTKYNVRAGGISPKADTIEDKELGQFDIQVDGGINPDTAKQCIEAGANILVSGSYIFENLNLADHIKALRHADSK